MGKTMELLMILMIASLGGGQGGFCEGIDITKAEAAGYARTIGIKKEWSGGEQPEWYTALVKNTAGRVADLSSKVEDKEICSYLEDVNKIIAREKFEHLLQNILITSFSDCNGISPTQLGKIDGGKYDITSKKPEDIEKTVLILKTQAKLKEKHEKNYCTFSEFTYDSIYKNQYKQ